MPNWCWNNLRINPTNKSEEAKAQVKKFVSDVKYDGEPVTIKEAKAYREKYIADNFENIYRDDADKFVKHSEMPVKEFMEKVLNFTYTKDKKLFKKGEEDFSMNKILPIPLEYTQEYKQEERKKREKELKKKYGSKDWYDWNVANWGTKWNVSDASIDEEEDGSVVYGYSTAWAPNCEFLKNICKQYPLLDFTLEYEEEGVGFEGTLEIVAGKVIKDEERPFTNYSCNNCGERQDDLDEGEKINDNGLCPSCQKEEDEESE
jgi:hypothetical protein